MQLSVKDIADSANMIYECTCNFVLNSVELTGQLG